MRHRPALQDWQRFGVAYLGGTPPCTSALAIALGSLRELDTQLIISKNVNLAKPEYIDSVLIDCDEMQKLVKSTINTLQLFS